MSMLNLLMGVMEGYTYSLSNLASSYSDMAPPTQQYGLRVWFRATNDGTVDVTKYIGSDLNDEETYVTPQNGPNLWVRCTQNSGTALNLGDATGSWHSLTSSQARSFGLEYTSGGGFDTVTANLDFEIATDSGGTNIVATKAGVDIEVGESA